MSHNRPALIRQWIVCGVGVLAGTVVLLDGVELYRSCRGLTGFYIRLGSWTVPVWSGFVVVAVVNYLAVILAVINGRRCRRDQRGPRQSP